MDQSAAHAAADFLRERDLTARITEDLTALGYVGEPENKLLAYLVAVSRKLDRPLGMVIQGPSGSGKSELVEKVLSLCPEEDVFFNTRLTAHSLYYVGLQDPFGVAHKVVAIEEAKGAEEANYALRVLLTRRRLDLQTTLHQAPVHIVLHGPVAYLDTTTEDLTDDERANRVLQVRTDASEAQTEAVLDAQRQRAATVPGPADQAIVARHQAAQRLLRPIPVIIPFAEQIRFPTQHTRARRDTSGSWTSSAPSRSCTSFSGRTARCMGPTSSKPPRTTTIWPPSSCNAAWAMLSTTSPRKPESCTRACSRCSGKGRRRR